MWADSSFGGDGGFVPGGGVGGSHFDSPARGSEKPKSTKRAQNIVPVTIKELLECQEETLVVAGTEAQVVRNIYFIDNNKSFLKSVHIDI
jgi:hypothetical protein